MTTGIGVISRATWGFHQPFFSLSFEKHLVLSETACVCLYVWTKSHYRSEVVTNLRFFSFVSWLCKPFFSSFITVIKKLWEGVVCWPSHAGFLLQNFISDFSHTRVQMTVNAQCTHAYADSSAVVYMYVCVCTHMHRARCTHTYKYIVVQLW